MVYTLLLSFNSGYVRSALRVYFTVAFLLISFVGNRCLAVRAQRNIKNKRQVPLTTLTGWLSDTSLAVAIYTFRRPPGGWLFGICMVLCTVFSLVSDLAVSALVVQVTVAARCPFGTGLVVADSYSQSGWWTVPPWNGAPYGAVAQAQLTSTANGGLVGIYWKVNRDMNFRADGFDI